MTIGLLRKLFVFAARRNWQERGAGTRSAACRGINLFALAKRCDDDVVAAFFELDREFLGIGSHSDVMT